MLLTSGVWIANNPEIVKNYCQDNEPTSKECPHRSAAVTAGIMFFNGLNFYGPAISALSGIAVAVFTIALAVSTRALWVETQKLAIGAEGQSADFKRSLDIAQAHANAASAATGSERAWMCFNAIPQNPSGAGQIDELSFKRGLALSVSWKNQGRSPAIGSGIIVEMRVVPYKDHNVIVFKPDWLKIIGGAAVGPGMTGASEYKFLTDTILLDFEEREESLLFCTVQSNIMTFLIRLSLGLPSVVSV